MNLLCHMLALSNLAVLLKNCKDYRKKETAARKSTARENSSYGRPSYENNYYTLLSRKSGKYKVKVRGPYILYEKTI